MKRIISVLLAVMLLAGAFSSCGNPGEIKNEKLSIVTTIFPEYDWVMNILGDRAQLAEVTMLLDSGVDLHSYQPTADDMIKIAQCDLFICVGGESDKWTDEAISSSANKNMKVLRLIDILGDSVREEMLVEGMEAEEEEAKEGEAEYDEHVWLSLKNAAVCSRAIAEALASLDEANASLYTANSDSYIEDLNALDEKYTEFIGNAENKTVLFADRFPFRYLVDDYSISYYAAFAGCSAESEASFETVTFLADKINELSLPAVIILEGSDGKLAKTVIEAAKAENIQTVTMDSMQSVTAEDVENGVSYFGIMEKNLEALKSAL